jgi:hypothetical protein
MAGKRLYAPSILIDEVEYKCKARSVSLEPGDHINFCEQEWTFTAEIELGYGVAESWNLLHALQDTIVDVVLKPEDSGVAATNPAAAFQIRMPSVPFMTGAARGERMTFSLEITTEAAPVFDLVA